MSFAVLELAVQAAAQVPPEEPDEEFGWAATGVEEAFVATWVLYRAEAGVLARVHGVWRLDPYQAAIDSALGSAGA